MLDWCLFAKKIKKDKRDVDIKKKKNHTFFTAKK